MFLIKKHDVAKKLVIQQKHAKQKKPKQIFFEKILALDCDTE